MNKELENTAMEHGDRIKIIAIEHLKDLKELIDFFKEEEELNDFQKWIVNDLYQFEIPEYDFKINSVILMAIHHPFYARVTFKKDGIKKTFLSLVRSDFTEAETYLTEIVEKKGYSLKTAERLPLKRLGVHSGLAKYGRNNITYIDGLGSNFSYAAYFSDMICKEDSWGELRDAEPCNNCNRCVESCPTGAIRKNRFLIDNQRCLSCINEVSGEFPQWLPLSVHHTLYDCLICQRVCPMNSKQSTSVIDNIAFTEEETKMLLEGKPINNFTKDLQDKVFLLGLDEWYDAIPRNLKVLFSQ